MKKLLIGAIAALFLSGSVFAGSFTDVADDSWYASEVSDVHRAGLMNGIGGGLFSPDGKVTVAEAVTMASRVNAAQKGETIPSSDGKWYDAYYDYAMQNGIIEDGTYTNYDEPAKRYEVASLFASALPNESFPKINDVTSVPDVYAEDEYFEELIKLYNAGVLTGNDEYGTFSPDSDITRAEAAAIVGRVAMPNKRVKKDFASPEVYYIIDAHNMQSGRNGLANGWLYDDKISLFNYSGRDSAAVGDATGESYAALYRDFDEEKDGTMILEIIADIRSEDDGIYIGFADKNEEIQFKLKTDNGYFTLCGLTELKTDIPVVAEGIVQYSVVMYIDLDNNTLRANIDNILTDTVEIPECAVTRLVIGSTVEGTGRIAPAQVRLLKNFATAEHFFAVASTDSLTPSGFDITGNITFDRTDGFPGADVYSAKIDASAGTVHSAYRGFTPVDGKGIFETYILLPEKTDGAYFALYDGENEVIRIESKNGAWYSGETFLRDYTDNVWQTLRIDTDLNNGKAVLKVCCKAVAELNVDAKAIDGIKIGFEPDTDAVMWFDDIKAHGYYDFIDYPEYPRVAESKDYNVGLHVCNLWRDNNGGEGWDSSTPFDELEPYLGFHDEGVTEFADWEIKMMVEHGIDFQHMCWYCPSTDINVPVKLERTSGHHLHDGFLNAKYSHLMKFCFMWENNSKNVYSFEQFKEYLWKYWKEYYFTDPRYAVLDNKPVLTVWSLANFKSSVGGVDGAKAAVEFMHEDMKNLGYDGIILLFADGHQMTKSFFDSVAEIGADATYPYHWNRTGIDADHQIYRMSTQISLNSIHTIPAVSVGFNDIGRNEQRTGLITPEGHKEVCEYIRDQALPARKYGDWRDNTFFVSTWNEYSEGTYVMPSNIHGYAYLENIKDVFTTDKSDHSEIDVIPTASQKHRITHMYPDNHQPIRWYQFEQTDISELDTTIDTLRPAKTWDFANLPDRMEWKHNHGLTNFDNTSGNVISGELVTKTDGAIVLANDLNIDINKLPYLHIRMKNSELANFEIFFITEDDTVWNGTKYVNAPITAKDEFVDYYVDMSLCYKWKGTLKKIRIDPMVALGKFEISLVELMYIDDTITVENPYPIVRVNGHELEFNFQPVITPDGDFEVTADPRKGFFSTIGLFHTWDRYTGVLMVESLEHRIYFTVGSDKAVLDGKEYDLGYSFKLRDGLPVIRLGVLSDMLGFKTHVSGKVMDVQSVSDEQFESIKQRVPFEWEFSYDDDSEGFTGQNSRLSAIDGFLRLDATGKDPAYISSVFKTRASLYTKIVVGIKADTSLMANGQWMQLFFTTSTSTSMSEDKSYKHYYNPEDMKDGEVYEVVFDLSKCEKWSGYITKIRIDPFNLKETCYIDYIRFVK